ncbi:MAG: hypothetical protein HDR88_08035 [Bacteroides sp.]|nr:hypothetical protein [Bacteroides sp.]
MLRFLPVLLMLVSFFCMASCINDDITDSPDARLSFSTDTLSFGTVFTDLGTPTARLVVFNRNKKGVNISSIKFKNPDSNFSLNVDGQSGTVFRDVEIRGNDSIHVFVECFISPDEAFEPQRVADQLEFVTNGNTQEVEVEAWGLNVTRLRGVRVESDMRLTPERPYIVFDSLSVEKGAILTIDPGTMLLFHDKAYLTVRGTLNAVGEVGNVIQMRGDRLDNVLPDVAYDILSGQWQGVRIGAGSFDNRIEYVDMRSTVEGVRVDSCADLSRQKLTLVNSWLHNSQSTVLDSRYAKVDAYGCCFSEAAGAVVSLTGGEHEFVQCTIANNYLWGVSGDNLSLYHCLPDHAADNTRPLMKANFENSIIWGIGSPINEGDLNGSQVFLCNVLLKANGSDDDNFINCIWNEDPLFYTVREDYYFNYRLKPDSPAIGKGNPSFVTPICEYDMDGMNRLLYGAPDLGAYVYIPPTE